jgi:tetratricopeptide (TPR) repeat protein
MAGKWPNIGVSMKRVRRCQIVAAAWAWIAVVALAPAANETAGSGGGAVGEAAKPKNPDDELIRRLGDDSWTVREQATRDLWAMGENATAMIKRAMLSEDPEVVRRVRMVANRIDLGLLPDTPEAVAELVRSYLSVDDRVKSTIVRRLFDAKAWRQVLRLYDRETSAEVRKSTRSYVDAAALRSAREALADGDPDKALEFLELAPHDARGLAAWAAFHAAQGSARDELKRLRGANGVAGAQRRMALFRALGDLSGAAREAESAGERQIAAAMHLLQGDPLPWMQSFKGEKEITPLDPFDASSVGNVFRDAYIRWAVKRWKTGEDDREIVDSLMQANLLRGDNTDLVGVMGVLFAMGERAAAEKTLEKLSPRSAALYYDASEKFGDFLRVMGLDPDKPDFPAWTKKRTDRMLADPDHTEDERDELLLLCGVLEARGRGADVASWLEGWLDTLMKKDSEVFLDVLGRLVLYGVNSAAMPAAVRYVGKDKDRFDQVVAEFVQYRESFGPVGDAGEAPKWIAGHTKDLPVAQRLRILAALTGILPGETKLRAEWIGRLRKAAEAAGGEERERLLGLLLEIIREGGEFEPALEVARELSKGNSVHPQFGYYLLLLSAGGQWREAADAWRKRVGSAPYAPLSHAYLAAMLRRAGCGEEAREEEKILRTMALGDGATCVGIGQAYASAGDFDRAAEWWRRALVEAPPRSDSWFRALELMRGECLEKKDWELSAALCEAVAIEQLGGAGEFSSGGLKLRARFDADFAKAMTLLPKNRERAMRMIDGCDELLPTDGSIADYFLPALRDAGLLAEHDRYFERAWKALDEMARRFPDAENTRNTLAWIAARAHRRLGEAARHIDRALSVRPNQAAFLDTRAEVWFGMGNRKKAVEWSRRAVQASPAEVSLRRQLKRFRTAPLPEGR